MSDTPRTDEVPSEESRIKRLREWAHRALLREPGAGIIERTVAEDVQHLEAKYQRDLAAERERADMLMRLAYLAGWNASGEGYNAEYPFGDSDMDPEADAKWIAVRDTALDAARRK